MLNFVMSEKVAYMAFGAVLHSDTLIRTRAELGIHHMLAAELLPANAHQAEQPAKFATEPPERTWLPEGRTK
jgi:hypothetical protein